MKTENLELRMYGLVPYNISPIQQAIQYGHAVVEYQLKHARSVSEVNGPNENGRLLRQYYHWAEVWKTFIILNGGTTNFKPLPEPLVDVEDGKMYQGSLNNHLQWLNANGIPNSSFREPDLGDQLTAVCFIVDERVFDYSKWVGFKEWMLEQDHNQKPDVQKWIKKTSESQLINLNPPGLDSYKLYLGGETNYNLRRWLKQFKFA